MCGLIAAYRANYDRLKSTKSSNGKKSVFDSIMDDFLSLCSDAGIESEKTLVQIKEKWRSSFENSKLRKTTTTRPEGTVKPSSFMTTATTFCQDPIRSTLNL